RFVVYAVERRRDKIADRLHLRLFHTPAGDGGSADSNSARDKGRAGIERHRIFINGDVRFIERLLRNFSSQLGLTEIYQHQMIVRSPGSQAKTFAHQRSRQSLGVLYDLLLIDFEV